MFRVACVCQISVLLILSACREEDMPGSMTFAEPKEGATVWNTITASLEITGDFRNGEVNLFLGDSLIGKADGPSFTFQLNTREFQDGQYQLTARAGSGIHSSSASVNIRIRNSLVTMTVPAQHLDPDERGFLFASDREGKLISTLEFKNGETVTLPGIETYPEKTFTLTEAYLREPASFEAYSILEVPRGGWTPLSPDRYPKKVDQINLQFTDKTDDIYFISSSGDSNFLYEEGLLNLNLTNAPTQLYVRQFKQKVNHYKIETNLTPGNLHTISLTGLDRTMSIEAVVPKGPRSKAVYTVLYGFPSADNSQEYYQLGSFYINGETIYVEYPGDDFARYGSRSFYQDNKVRVNAFNPVKKFDANPLTATVNFEKLTDGKARVESYGSSFDMLVANWSYLDGATSSLVTWSVVCPPNRSQHLRPPALPNLLARAGWENKLAFASGIQIADYEIASDYAGFLEYASHHSLTGPYRFGLQWKEQVFLSSGETRGRTEAREFTGLSDRFFRD